MGWVEGGHWPSEIWRWEEISGGRLLSRGRDGGRGLLRTSVLATLWGKGLNHLRNDVVSLMFCSPGRDGLRVCGSRVSQGPPRESLVALGDKHWLWDFWHRVSMPPGGSCFFPMLLCPSSLPEGLCALQVARATSKSWTSKLWEERYCGEPCLLGRRPEGCTPPPPSPPPPPKQRERGWRWE